MKRRVIGGQRKKSRFAGAEIYRDKVTFPHARSEE
jgi:hypothetical protein